MMRSPAAQAALRQWCIRSSCVFAAVYLVGLFGVPTLIPYVTALLVVVGDAIRLARHVRGGSARQGGGAALGGHDDTTETRTAKRGTAEKRH